VNSAQFQSMIDMISSCATSQTDITIDDDWGSLGLNGIFASAPIGCLVLKK